VIASFATPSITTFIIDPLILLLIVVLSTTWYSPVLASAAAVKEATVFSKTPSAGSYASVTPDGKDEERPKVAFEREYDFDFNKDTVTCLVSPGFNVITFSESDTEYSVRGTVFSCAKFVVTVAATKTIESRNIFFIAKWILLHASLRPCHCNDSLFSLIEASRSDFGVSGNSLWRTVTIRGEWTT